MAGFGVTARCSLSLSWLAVRCFSVLVFRGRRLCVVSVVLCRFGWALLVDLRVWLDFGFLCGGAEYTLI